MTVFTKSFERCLDLTLYQFYELYPKFMNRDKYEKNFSMFIAGSDPKKLDLDNHWTNKIIEKKEETPPQSVVK